MPDPIIDQLKQQFNLQPLGNVSNVAPSLTATGFEPLNTFDKGLTFGMNQQANRANNQGFISEVYSGLANLIPNTAGTIVEGIGQLGEIFDSTGDYDNSLIRLGKDMKNAWANPIYTQQALPDQIFSRPVESINSLLFESLLPSASAFAVEGMGIGALLNGVTSLSNAGKVANTLNQVFRGANVSASTVGKLTNIANNIATAGLLAYTEGAMSGNEVYKKIYNSEIQKNGDSEESQKNAREKARIGANTTVGINTIINTALNFTGVSQLFKPTTVVNQAREALKQADNLLLKIPKETSDEIKAIWKRTDIDDATKRGLLNEQLENTTAQLKNQFKSSFDRVKADKELNPKSLLLGEALQEGFEEVTNQYAEQQGLKAKSNKDFFNLLFDVESYGKTMFSKEGLFNFFAGAFGGGVQKVMLDTLQKMSDKNSSDDEALNAVEKSYNQVVGIMANGYAKNAYFKAYQEALKDVFNDGRIDYDTYKQNLQDVRDNIFQNSALTTALLSGSSDNLVSTFDRIARLDNQTNLLENYQEQKTQLEGLKSTATEEELPQIESRVKELDRLKEVANQLKSPDYLTQAMLEGVTDSPKNNEYVREANKKIQQIQEYATRYENYNRIYNSPIHATELVMQEIDLQQLKTLEQRVQVNIDNAHLENTNKAQAEYQKEWDKLMVEGRNTLAQNIRDIEGGQISFPSVEDAQKEISKLNTQLLSFRPSVEYSAPTKPNNPFTKQIAEKESELKEMYKPDAVAKVEAKYEELAIQGRKEITEDKREEANITIDKAKQEVDDTISSNIPVEDKVDILQTQAQTIADTQSQNREALTEEDSQKADKLIEDIKKSTLEAMVWDTDVVASLLETQQGVDEVWGAIGKSLEGLDKTVQDTIIKQWAKSIDNVPNAYHRFLFVDSFVIASTENTIRRFVLQEDLLDKIPMTSLMFDEDSRNNLQGKIKNLESEETQRLFQNNIIPLSDNAVRRYVQNNIPSEVLTQVFGKTLPQVFLAPPSIEMQSDGMYKNGVIYVNIQLLSNPSKLAKVLVHEIGHSIHSNINLSNPNTEEQQLLDAISNILQTTGQEFLYKVFVEDKIIGDTKEERTASKNRNILEMIAYFYEDNELIETIDGKRIGLRTYLNGIEYKDIKGNSRTLAQDFIEAVKNFIKRLVSGNASMADVFHETLYAYRNKLPLPTTQIVSENNSVPSQDVALTEGSVDNKSPNEKSKPVIYSLKDAIVKRELERLSKSPDLNTEEKKIIDMYQKGLSMGQELITVSGGLEVPAFDRLPLRRVEKRDKNTGELISTTLVWDSGYQRATSEGYEQWDKYAEQWAKDSARIDWSSDIEVSPVFRNTNSYNDLVKFLTKLGLEDSIKSPSNNQNVVSYVKVTQGKIATYLPINTTKETNKNSELWTLDVLLEANRFNNATDFEFEYRFSMPKTGVMWVSKEDKHKMLPFGRIELPHRQITLDEVVDFTVVTSEEGNYEMQLAGKLFQINVTTGNVIIQDSKKGVAYFVRPDEVNQKTVDSLIATPISLGKNMKETLKNIKNIFSDMDLYFDSDSYEINKKTKKVSYRKTQDSEAIEIGEIVDGNIQFNQNIAPFLQYSITDKNIQDLAQRGLLYSREAYPDNTTMFPKVLEITGVKQKEKKIKTIANLDLQSLPDEQIQAMDNVSSVETSIEESTEEEFKMMDIEETEITSFLNNPSPLFYTPIVPVVLPQGKEKIEVKDLPLDYVNQIMGFFDYVFFTKVTEAGITIQDILQGSFTKGGKEFTPDKLYHFVRESIKVLNNALLVDINKRENKIPTEAEKKILRTYKEVVGDSIQSENWKELREYYGTVYLPSKYGIKEVVIKNENGEKELADKTDEAGEELDKQQQEEGETKSSTDQRTSFEIDDFDRLPKAMKLFFGTIPKITGLTEDGKYGFELNELGFPVILDFRTVYGDIVRNGDKHSVIDMLQWLASDVRKKPHYREILKRLGFKIDDASSDGISFLYNDEETIKRYFNQIVEFNNAVMKADIDHLTIAYVNGDVLVTSGKEIASRREYQRYIVNKLTKDNKDKVITLEGKTIEEKVSNLISKLELPLTGNDEANLLKLFKNKVKNGTIDLGDNSIWRDNYIVSIINRKVENNPEFMTNSVFQLGKTRYTITQQSLYQKEVDGLVRLAKLTDDIEVEGGAEEEYKQKYNYFIQEAIKFMPHLGSTFSDAENSKFLKQLFDSVRKGNKVGIANIGGAEIFGNDEVETKKASFLSVEEMNFAMSLGNSLSGNTIYSPFGKVNETKNSEYGIIGIGQYIKTNTILKDEERAWEEFHKQMEYYFNAEKATITEAKKAFGSNPIAFAHFNTKHEVSGLKKVFSFRLFDAVAPYDKVKEFIDGADKLDVTYLDIKEAWEKYVRNQIKDYTELRTQQGVGIVKGDGNEATVTGISDSLVRDVIEDEKSLEERIEKLNTAHILNQIIHSYELNKIFFGDPAQYKPFEMSKREASIMGTKDFLIDAKTHNYFAQMLSKDDKSELVDDIVNSRAEELISLGELKKEDKAKWIEQRLSEQRTLNIPDVDGKHRFKFNPITGRTEYVNVENDVNTPLKKTLSSLDEYLKNEEFKRLGYLDTIDASLEDLTAWRKGIEDAYNGAKTTDASARMSLDKYRAFSLRIPNAWTEVNEAIYQALKSGMDYTELEQVFDRGDIVNTFSPKKFVFAQQVMLSDMYPNLYAGSKLSTMVYHKYALIPVWEGDYKDNEGNAITEEGVFLDYIKDFDLDYYTYDSGSKTNFFRLSETAGKFEDYIATLPLSGQGEQVKQHTHAVNETKLKTQANKLIYLDVPSDVEDDIRKLVEEHKKNFDDYLDLQYQRVLDDFGIEKVGDDLQITNGDKLKELIIQELGDEATPNMLEGINNIPNETIIVDSSPIREKVEQILQSVLSKRLIEYKIYGEDYVQASSAGQEFTQEYKDKINSRLPINQDGNLNLVTKELNFYRMSLDNSTILPAQLGVPIGKEQLAYLDKIPDGYYTQEELDRKNGQGKQLSENEKILILNRWLRHIHLKRDLRYSPDEQVRIDNELTLDENNLLEAIQMVGMRVPTQGYNSIEQFEVGYFIPRYYLHSFMPLEQASKSGGDYDVDKITIYKRNLSKDGKLIVDLGGEPNGKVIQNNIVDTFIKVITHPRNFISLITPNDASPTKSIATEIAKEMGTTTDAIYREHKGKGAKHSMTREFMPTATMEDRYEKRAGKQLTGIKALWATAHALFQQVKAFIPIENDKVKVKTGEVKNKDESVTPIYTYYSLPFTRGGKQLSNNKELSLSEIRNAMGRVVSQINSNFIDGTVDSAKDNWVTKLGDNLRMGNVIASLVNMGFDVDNIAYFAMQPIVRLYNQVADQNESMAFKASGLELDNKKLQQLFNYVYTSIKENVDSSSFEREFWKQWNKVTKKRAKTGWNKKVIEDFSSSQDSVFNEDYAIDTTSFTTETLRTSLNTPISTKQQLDVFKILLEQIEFGRYMGDTLKAFNMDAKGTSTSTVVDYVKIQTINNFAKDTIQTKDGKNAIDAINQDSVVKYAWRGFQLANYTQQILAPLSNDPILLEEVYKGLNRPMSSENKEKLANLIRNNILTAMLFNSEVIIGDKKTNVSAIHNDIKGDNKTMLTTLSKLQELAPENDLVKKLYILSKASNQSNVDVLAFPRGNGKFTVPDKNKYEKAFKELYDNPNTKPYTQALAVIQLIQQGKTFTPYTLVDFIPEALYRELYNQFKNVTVNPAYHVANMIAEVVDRGKIKTNYAIDYSNRSRKKDALPDVKQPTTGGGILENFTIEEDVRLSEEVLKKYHNTLGKLKLNPNISQEENIKNIITQLLSPKKYDYSYADIRFDVMAYNLIEGDTLTEQDLLTGILSYEELNGDYKYPKEVLGRIIANIIDGIKFYEGLVKNKLATTKESVPPITDDYFLQKVVEIFSIEDYKTTRDKRDFKYKPLREYGMSDAQYKWAVNHQEKLVKLLEENPNYTDFVSIVTNIRNKPVIPTSTTQQQLFDNPTNDENVEYTPTQPVAIPSNIPFTEDIIEFQRKKVEEQLKNCK